MKRPIKILIFFSIFLISGAILTNFLLATEVGDQPKATLGNNNEIIDGNLIKVNNKIKVENPVNGDVIFAGGVVEILKPVAGDVLGVGGVIKIKSEILGNVRIIGGTIEIEGLVERNINVFGGKLLIKEDAKIGRDVYLGVNKVEIKGDIEGSLLGSGTDIVLGGKIGKDVNLILDNQGQLVLEPKAVIAGDLTYKAVRKGQLIKKAGAEVLGQVVPKIFTVQKTKFIASYVFAKIISLFGLLIVGLVMLTLAPRIIFEVKEKMIHHPFHHILWGLIYLIIFPLLIFILILTIIGFPLAVILGVAYFIILYISQVLAGIALGFFVVGLSAGRSYKGSLMWPMILGMILFVVLTSLPFIGLVIKLILIFWAFGALIETKKELLKEHG